MNSGFAIQDRRTILFVGLIIALSADVYWPTAVSAQSATASLSGTIEDETAAAVADVEVAVVNAATGLQRQAKSNASGTFTISVLPPGKYRLTATRDGFAPTKIDDIVLNVGDAISVIIRLKVAALTESVSVTVTSPRLNTSPAVSTVIDRQFVENLPLNGRTLQSLLELTPGVVLTPTGGPLQGGQFSVNGQRTNSNYLTVDGVSANVGINSSPSTLTGHSGSGQLPGLTAQGGTNGLVSVDALQEFRIHTSTYAPEFGHMPGGQVSFVTRAGTNGLHGSVFEYFRHDAMDANDWFANRNGLPKARLRQHDVGGVVGGPIVRNRSFFFASYERLRLELPQVRIVTVPSRAIRQMVPAAARPLFDAYPVPNGRDFADLTSEFIASYSDPSRLDAMSVRIDQALTPQLTLFSRVNYAPSANETRRLSEVSSQQQDNHSVTAGLTWIAASRLTNDLRVNWTHFSAPYSSQLDDFGGAIVPTVDAVFMPGRTPDRHRVHISAAEGAAALLVWGSGTRDVQRQFNIVETLSWMAGAHHFKFGFDYRAMLPILSGASGLESFVIPDNDAVGTKYDNLLQGRLRGYQLSENDPTPRSVRFPNVSVYMQDRWTPRERLTLTYGLRWEIVPPPHASTGQDAITLDNLDAPGASLRVAPPGTQLWRTRYNNLAPRAGASYQAVQREGRESVIKGGFGIFYDLGLGQSANGFHATYPFAADRSFNNVAFPLASNIRVPPQLRVDPPLQLWVMDRGLRLPFTYQWSVSLEQAIGRQQSLTASYVGAAGRRLLTNAIIRQSVADWPTTPIILNITRGDGTSDYRALQLQFQRRLTRGLQSMVSYTWGRSLDTASNDQVSSGSASRPDLLRLEYGPSSYDVRHILSAAISYNIPSWQRMGPIFRNWGVDSIVRARSGFPVNVVATSFLTPEGLSVSVRPNRVPGVPLELDDPSVPGGRRFNRAAFTVPAPGQQGDFPRNGLRDFGASQVDLALRRDFGVGAGLRLQFRGELFNLLNQVNFGARNGSLNNALFGQPTSMLNRSLGGLNALYQIGGPRSAQLSVKLLF